MQKLSLHHLQTHRWCSDGKQVWPPNTIFHVTLTWSRLLIKKLFWSGIKCEHTPLMFGCSSSFIYEKMQHFVVIFWHHTLYQNSVFKKKTSECKHWAACSIILRNNLSFYECSIYSPCAKSCADWVQVRVVRQRKQEKTKIQQQPHEAAVTHTDHTSHTASVFTNVQREFSFVKHDKLHLCKERNIRFKWLSASLTLNTTKAQRQRFVCGNPSDFFRRM